MSDDKTYSVLVTPDGIDPADADSTHSFEFKTDTTDYNGLEQEAIQHIIDNNIIDPVSFRKYWEIKWIKEGSENLLHDLKQKLMKLDQSTIQKLNNQTQGSGYTITLRGKHPDKNDWFEFSLLLDEHRINDLEQWFAAAEQTLSVSSNDYKYLSEAAIRAVAESSEADRITTDMLSDPTVHDEFVTQIEKNTQCVENHYVGISP